MNLAKFSVHNSLLVNLISILLFFAGIIAVFNLTREAFPNISFDTVMIETAYPGSTPLEVEKLITIPIEDELNQVDHIDELSSISAEGYSVITAEIAEDAPNKDRVINDIQQAVNRVQGLPSDLEDKPVARELSTQDRPVITISLSGNIPETKLQDYARTLERLYLQIPGVGKISREGWREREFRVEVRPDVMALMHVSLAEIMEALKKHNVSVPGGSFYEDNKEYIIRTSGEFESAAEIGDVVVRANPGGNWITVKDVAMVRADFEEEKIISKTAGSRAIGLTVIKKASGDTIDIVAEVHAIGRQFKEKVKDDVNISTINDSSYYIKRRLNVLVSNGWIGLILVIISLFAFLNFRIALGASLGIPTAILTSLAIMYWLGISINLLSMFGMIMVIGMLVDEEIVTSENIYRHLQQHDSQMTAVINGTAEVNRAVFATVLTTISAFIPLFFMSGRMGKFTQNIPVVVIITLVSSLASALFLLPSHLYHLSRWRAPRENAKNFMQERSFFIKLLALYEKTLKKALRFRYQLTTVLVIAVAGCILYAVTGMRFVLFPSRGIEIFYIQVEGEAGDDLHYTDEKILPIEKIVSELPPTEIDAYVTHVGISAQDFDNEYTERGTHKAQITVYLTPAENRKRTSDEIIQSIRPKIEAHSQFKSVRFEEVHHGPPVGHAVEARIQGDEFATLQEIASQLKQLLKGMPGVVDIKDDSDLKLDELHIQVDAKKSAQAGLNISDIAFAVRSAFAGSTATTIKKTAEEIDVVVQLPESAQSNPAALNNLLIENQDGNLIPLNRVASLQKTTGLQVIKHHDSMRVVTVTANVDENKTTAMAANRTLLKHFGDIPMQYPGYQIAYGGEQKDTAESLKSLFNAFYVALALILIILVAMFRSLIYAMVILVSIPFSIIGVVIAFLIHDLPLSFMAVLGLVGLTGVVVNSGIIVIDFIERARKQGMGAMESIIEGSKLRFRPIVLTSLTTVLAVIPSAYGIGGLDPFIQPMALTMNYGLVVGAGLSLIFVPCLVAITDDIKKLCHR